uniref:CSON000436 protein n=1 Tax=Culicoides sonorensis TaxID=179676 RepID=A0A336MH83_CULSO
MGQNYLFNVRKIICRDIDTKYIKNVTCYIKAERSRLGVLNLEYTFVNADNVKFTMRQFSRNSHGNYQPLLVPINFDLCNLNDRDSNSLFNFGDIIKKEIKKNFPAFTNGCPVNGTFKMLNADWNRDTNRVHDIIPILPTGDFAINSRYYNGITNRTYINVNIYWTVQRAGRNAVDLSFLNMG